MQRKRPSQIGAAREARVRALGFDPGQLTPEEQVELLEICAAWPDPARQPEPSRRREAPLA